MYVLVYVLLTSMLCCMSVTIHDLISLRLETLKLIAKTSGLHCSTDKYIVMSGQKYGQTGNEMIEFTHGLWVARKLNATLALPEWMQDIFAPIDPTILRRNFCFTTQKIPNRAKSIVVTPVELFYTSFLNSSSPIFIAHNRTTIVQEMSLHFLKVYSAFWSSPLPAIREAGERLITRYLDSSLRYTAVHIRNFEGGCSKTLSISTNVSDYSPDEIPIDSPVWKGNLRIHHPICEMPIEMVLGIQKLRHRYNSSLFVAHDGQTDISNYEKYGAVFSSHLLSGSEKILDPRREQTKFIDQFVAMHSELFILNPRSTFSWEVFVVRVGLALDSVPIIKNNDFYLRMPEEGAKGTWISWTSVMDSFLSTNR